MDAAKFIEDGLAKGYIHETDSVETLTIDGHRDSYKVYEVRTNILKYNIRNGRIATYITRYKQEQGDLPADGSEDMNALIEKFIEESNPQRLKKTKLDIKAKGQQRPAVILSDGTIIDGNRGVSLACVNLNTRKLRLVTFAVLCSMLNLMIKA